MALDGAQLEQLWVNAGGAPALAQTMAAIALAESSGIPTQLNTKDHNGAQTSAGLWQISTGTHELPSPNWADPQVNAQLAVQKYNSQGLTAWGTYTSGEYLSFLNQVPQYNSSGINNNILASYNPNSSSYSTNTLSSSSIGGFNPLSSSAFVGAGVQNAAQQSSVSGQGVQPGLGAANEIFAYLQEAMHPNFRSTNFFIFSLNFSSIAGLLVRAGTIIVGALLVKNGIERLSQASVGRNRSTKSIPQSLIEAGVASRTLNIREAENELRRQKFDASQQTGE